MLLIRKRSMVGWFLLLGGRNVWQIHIAELDNRIAKYFLIIWYALAYICLYFFLGFLLLVHLGKYFELFIGHVVYHDIGEVVIQLDKKVVYHLVAFGFLCLGVDSGLGNEPIEECVDIRWDGYLCSLRVVCLLGCGGRCGESRFLLFLFAWRWWGSRVDMIVHMLHGSIF